jgi:hypothetical protein
MFNRRDVVVRPLDEEIEELGLDPAKVMSDIERVSGKLIEGGSPLTSGGALTEDTDDDLVFEGDDAADELVFDDEGDGYEYSDAQLEAMEFDEDVDADLLDEKLVFRKRGYRMKTVDGKKKLVKMTSAEKKKERAKRMRKRGSLRAAARMYRKRFKTKIAKRRRQRKRKPARKGMQAIRMSDTSKELANLREELEQSGVSTGEPSPFEEAALNAGYLALLLGEIFESVGDAEAGEMLRAMSDSAATLSENIEANGGELDENTEAKLTSLLEGVSKAMAAHENLGEPGLFEAIDMGIESGALIVEEDEDEDEPEVDGDDDFDFDDDE